MPSPAPLADEIRVWRVPAAGALPVPVQVPTPTPGPGEVLVLVVGAVFDRDEIDALARPGAIPGGAAAGTIVAAGPGAESRVGESVVVGPLLACGECAACAALRPAACASLARLGEDRPGALATHLVVPARVAWPCASSLGPAAAALPREAALAATLLARVDAAAGEPVAWIGGGPLAAIGAALSVARGALPIAPEGDELRLEPRALGDALAARLATGGAAGRALHAVVAAAPTPAAWRRAVALAGPAGRAALLHRHGDPITVDALGGEAAVHAVSGPHPDLVLDVIGLAARGGLDLAGLVDVRPIADLAAVVDAFRTGAPRRLVILLP